MAAVGTQSLTGGYHKNRSRRDYDRLGLALLDRVKCFGVGFHRGLVIDAPGSRFFASDLANLLLRGRRLNGAAQCNLSILGRHADL
jgi:hypothetical protein